jgi:acyl carrier protein
MGLVAYAVPEPGGVVHASELRRSLKRKLPDYMIPSSFVVLDILPRTAHGKIDKTSLPDPTVAEIERETAYIPPGDEIEQKLVAIWEEILGVDPIGVEDNFFELGGHSLRAIQMINRIFRELGVTFTLGDLFTYQNVSALADCLKVMGVSVGAKPDQDGSGQVGMDREEMII